MKHFILIILTFTIMSVLLITISNIVQTKIHKIAFTVNAETPYKIQINYSNQVATGSPLVFGGVHAPNNNDPKAWDLLAEAGVTIIRRDFFIENELPKNITLKDYQNNVNGVQDPTKWNVSTINETNEIYKNAKNRGMKVIGIVSYIPKWLSYIDNSFGIPKDWITYKDIVKKLYRLHRPYLDYVEIWNESDIEEFLNLSGSGYSRVNAYLKIYETASQAIREVDEEENDNKIIPIIGLAASDAKNTDLLNSLLINIPIDNLNGISLHNYNEDKKPWATFQNTIISKGRNIPIFVDEWNQSSEYKKNPYIYTNLAIPYTGRKLIEFLKSGIEGANYYSTALYVPSSKNKYENSFGFYKILNGEVQLLPQSKTWRILSKTLGLGSGETRVMQSEADNQTVIGFINSKGKYGTAVVNESNQAQITSIHINNIPFKSKVTTRVFRASEIDDGYTQICSDELPVINGTVDFQTVIPQNSVAGITFEPVKLTAQVILNVLGLSTAADCIIKP